MKHIARLICLVSALFMTACVGDASFYIASTNVLNNECMPDENTQQGGGDLDVSLQGDSGAYYIGLIVRNDMDNSESAAAPAQRNTVTLRHLLLKTDIDGDVTEETLDIAGTTEAGGGTTLMSVNILGPKTFEKMASLATEKIQEANIEIKVKGKMLGGEWIVSRPYYFPIDFYASGETPPEECGENEVLAKKTSSKCLSLPLGQDGTTMECVEKEDNGGGAT